MLSIACLLALSARHTANAGDDAASGQPNERMVLAGTIGDMLRVTLDLSARPTRSNEDPHDTLTGSYRYIKVGQPIELIGRRTGLGRNEITLTERVGNKTTGRWRLELKREAQDPNKPDAMGEPTYTGTWTSADGKRELPVKLAIAARYDLARRSVGGVTVEWSLPLFLGDNQRALRETLEPIYDAQRQALNRYVTDLQLQTEVPLPGRPSGVPYWYELNASVVHHDDTLTSLLFDQYTYTGGAHPNSDFMTVTLVKDANAYNQVTLASLFQNEQAIEQALGPQVVAELIKAGWADGFDDRKDHVFKAKELSKFTLGAAGLTVYFEPYAIASYAEGPFVVTVPWDKLAGVIALDGPARRWVK